MNASVTAFFAPLLQRRSYPRTVLEAWRRITWEQLALAAMLGVVASAPAVLIAATAPRPFNMVGFVTGKLITAFCILLAIAVADDASDRGARRMQAYSTALIIGILAGTALSWLAWDRVFGMFGDQATGGLAEKLRINPNARYTIAMNAILEWLMLGSLAIYVYADRRETLKIRARLHEAELDRVRASQRLLESELQAMQARVAPEFLFDTLADVRRLYAAGAPDAEELLDHLIAYLRAAMPQTRDTSSTLSQEFDLVRSYLAIISAKTGGNLAYAIDAAPSTAEARLPAMMLQPLVDFALDHWSQSPNVARRLRITSESRDNRLRVVVSSDHAGEPTAIHAPVVAQIRERLEALYPANANLVLTQSERRGREAVMDIPGARA